MCATLHNSSGTASGCATVHSHLVVTVSVLGLALAILPANDVAAASTQSLAVLRDNTAAGHDATGEPFIFGMPDDNRDRFIARQGLRIISEVGTNELRRRYLPVGLVDASAPSQNYLCTAEVPERR